MLEKLKLYLGITDSGRDDLLNLIISGTQSRLKVLLGGTDEVPDALEYIIIDVAAVRYNRIGSEGLSSHTVEGETMSWSENDFEPFMDDINAYLESQHESRGVIRFL
jgi:hypothetical protein